MRKTLLLLLVFFATNVIAQEKKVQLGLHLTPGLYWVSTNDINVIPNSSKINLSFGVMIDFNFSNNVGLSTGLGLKTIGQDYTWNYISGSGNGPSGISYSNTYIINARYLELPLMLRIRTNGMNGMRFFGQLGLSSGYNISASTKLTSVNNTDQTTTNTENTSTDDIYYLREAINIGFGIEYKLSESITLLSSINYDSGFTKMLTSVNSANDHLNNPEFKAKGTVFSIGILF